MQTFSPAWSHRVETHGVDFRERSARLGLMRRHVLELIGRRFGMLMVVDHTMIEHRTRWRCVCDCGGTSLVTTRNLTSGNSTTCGCGKRPKGPRKDLAGRKFGKLAVVELARMKRTGPLGCIAVWRCLCDCGNHCEALVSALLSGKKKSCGCLMREAGARNRLLAKGPGPRHGRSGTRIHRIWKGMRTRCTNKNVPCYPRYGGRGIRICAHWGSFENFLADMGDPPTEKHSIDRVDNNRNYSCGHCQECVANGWIANCSWATGKQQTRHTRRSRMITVDGVTEPMAYWCEKYGVKHSLIKDRLRMGWSDSDAVKLPARARRSAA